MTEPQNDCDVQEKFRILYKDYASALIFYASRFVDKNTAEDVVQDVFLKIWDKRLFLMGRKITGLPL
jgi:RNA polymerase sigma-70 factor (ECF subfamily)